MGKKHLVCNSRVYLDRAEQLLRNMFADRPEIGVWRLKCDRLCNFVPLKTETIFVGLLDETKPGEPSELIILETYLHYTGVAEMAIKYAGGIGESSSVPFGGGWVPLHELKLLAEKAHRF